MMKYCALLILTSCKLVFGEPPENYGEDLAFLREYTQVIELRDGNAAIAIAPAYQGRVMTSTATGNRGYGFGWLNYKLIAQGVLPTDQVKGKLEEHIYVFGGEERFWLGPEGGQFGIFFRKGASFDFASWKTPAPLDTEPFKIISTDKHEASFTHEFAVTNQSGTEFKVHVERKVRLLQAAEITPWIGEKTSTLQVVAYETVNTLTNTGDLPWSKDSGLLSIWLLGMFKPTPGTVVAIPIKDGTEEKLGPACNDAYFGKVPTDRLKIENHVIYFKGDGSFRSKIGVPPLRSRGVAGSYNPEAKALTLTFYKQPEGVTDYVNSAWEVQRQPFTGDAINSYNDGSPEPEKPPLGPFYELETSSPAAALAPAASITHSQTTLHLTGSTAALDAVALKHLHTTTGTIVNMFAKEQ